MFYHKGTIHSWGSVNFVNCSESSRVVQQEQQILEAKLHHQNPADHCAFPFLPTLPVPFFLINFYSVVLISSKAISLWELVFFFLESRKCK